ncbi:hypothetical protein EHQ27_10315 [Leptospira wolffii]|uniref:S8 family serine peptidase n=1 Tax=Leptospira wolffii TaxID=409998 RepID=UPI001083138A|nr:S8 family serine peptidase [Leptospira wolffii]TGK56742.1 hypothetical protein EHQ32_14215 [Leptospira wolffii]TGK71676.1 hypothetical protein EHQ27_10315 [Leptospira wolffii]TGK75467.1 hypothetical protein EHQ35_03590 [Leptospira wolffii]TGL33043.1 hypothetical protein EHQ57_00940 [Leptospira wolffii]
MSNRKLTFLTVPILGIVTLIGVLWGQSIPSPKGEYNKPYLQSIKSKLKIAPGGKFIQDEIIVKFKSNIGESSRTYSVQSLGGTQQAKLSETGHQQLIKIPEGQSVESAVQAYSKLPEVESVQPNYVYHMSSVPTPNDPYYSQQWAVKNTKQTVTKVFDDLYTSSNPPSNAGNDTNLENAWEITTDCSSTIIAVLDTGINYNHEDLKDNIWESQTCPGYWGPKPCKGVDEVDLDSTPMDYNGHGTHVAGIIAAKGNNGIGIAGVCWSAKIMSVRVLDAFGNGTSSSIVSGINFALQNGAKVINMSLDGPTYDPSMYSAINSGATTYDTLFVVAAGSKGYDLGSAGVNRYPCEYLLPNIVCVGATDQNGYSPSFSNTDSSVPVSNRSVDILAPGANVLSTYNKVTMGNFWDDLSSGWTFSGVSQNDWGVVISGTTSCFSGTWFSLPPGCGNGPIAANTDTYAYKTFDLSSYDEIEMSNSVKLESHDSGDIVEFWVNPLGGNPVQNGFMANRPLQDPANTFESYRTDLTSACKSVTCSIGFRMVTDPGTSGPSQIVLVSAPSFVWARPNSAYSYNALSGTSMSTPYVTGTAAMLRSMRPSFNYADILNALVNSGNVTTTSTAYTRYGTNLDTYKALIYLHPPTITAGVQQ